jgi:hypothetical protein
VLRRDDAVGDFCSCREGLSSDEIDLRSIDKVESCNNEK